MEGRNEPRKQRRRASVPDLIDQGLLKNPGRLVIALCAAAIAVALLAATIFFVFDLGPDQHSRLSARGAIWEALQRTMDPGQLANAHGAFGIAALITTLIGLLLVTTLISLMNNQVQQRVDEVKRGREPARLSKRDLDRFPYYVVLGWSEVSLKVLSELAQSTPTDMHSQNGDRSGVPLVTVMAQMSVQDMQAQVDARRDHDHTMLPRHWQFRTGNPTDKRDLVRICQIEKATSVIVLAPEHSSIEVTGAPRGPDEVSDATAHVITTLTAIDAALANRTSQSASADDPAPPTVVVEVAETAVHAARVAQRIESRFADVVSGIKVVTVDGSSIMTRLTAQVSRQRDLARIYDELLDFSGCEFRQVSVPDALKPSDGPVTFGAVVAAVTGGIVIGVIDHPSDENGTTPGESGLTPGESGLKIDLWPSWDQKLSGNAKLIVVADDAGSVTATVSKQQPPKESRERSAPLSEVGDVVILGWNHRAASLVEMIRAGSSGSSPIHVVAPCLQPDDVASGADLMWEIRSDGIQQWIDEHGCPSELHGKHVIVLGDDDVSAEVSDAMTLLTIQALHPPGATDRPNAVVAELRKRSSRYLVKHLYTELIVGDSLVALMLAQYAVNPEVKEIVNELASPDSGVEIDVIKCGDVPGIDISAGGKWTFRKVQEEVWNGGLIALGYVHSPEPEGTVAATVVLNPQDPDEPVVGFDDRLVVLVNRHESPRSVTPGS
ncbi:MAG TPA: hypothetical protein PLS63_06300 [Microthrixaceae bacterium]|nr:hypothetical protein [Microthrixaceae bacterium]